jgi:hypothetical protein
MHIFSIVRRVFQEKNLVTIQTKTDNKFDSIIIETNPESVQ